MTFIVSLILICFVVGLVAVASNPSPYFGALGLVVASGMGCGVLVGHGGSFLALVLFLVYLGGMLVVFAYSAALAAEPYPETLGSRSVLLNVLLYVAGVGVSAAFLGGSWNDALWTPGGEADEASLFRTDIVGVAEMYSSGGWMLMMGAWVLFLALLVVLEVVRGLDRGSIRPV